jgi:hypothetical protein
MCLQAILNLYGFLCKKNRPKDIILEADDNMTISGETKLSACRELSPAYGKHYSCTLWLIRKMICSTKKKKSLFLFRVT